MQTQSTNPDRTPPGIPEGAFSDPYAALLALARLLAKQAAIEARREATGRKEPQE